MEVLCFVWPRYATIAKESVGFGQTNRDFATQMNTHLRITPGVPKARRRFVSSKSVSATLIHGWFNTAWALKRFGASFTNKPRIKSFASSEISFHSLSGKLKRPANGNSS